MAHCANRRDNSPKKVMPTRTSELREIFMAINDARGALYGNHTIGREADQRSAVNTVMLWGQDIAKHCRSDDAQLPDRTLDLFPLRTRIRGRAKEIGDSIPPAETEVCCATLRSFPSAHGLARGSRTGEQGLLVPFDRACMYPSHKNGPLRGVF